MAKVRGVIQLTAKPGYPKLSRQGGNQSVEMQYICSEEELSLLPEEGDPFTDTDYPFFTELPVTLVSCDAERQKNGQAYDVVLKYESASGDGGADAPVLEEYDYDTQDADVPLNALVNYRTKWNHDLLGLQAAIDAGSILTGTPPDWRATATDTKITDDTERKNYQWIVANETPPDGWKVLFNATKPDTQHFMFGFRYINAVQRCSNKTKLEKMAARDYSIETPAETFDMTGEFIRGGSKITREGRLWVLRVAYINITKVDTDIYRVDLPPDIKPPVTG